MDKQLIIELNEDERLEVANLIELVSDRYSSVNDPKFIENIYKYIEYLPLRVRVAIKGFRNQNIYVMCVVKGFTSSESFVGPTPNHWREVKDAKTYYDYCFTIISSVLGDVYGFSNLQDGKLVQEIFPIKDDCHKQLGTGSVELYLHTEDTSLDYRADYLGFMCMRNDEKIPTNVAVPEFGRLSEKTKSILKESKFRIFNDRPCFKESGDEVPSVITSILYGVKNNECMRYDPLYMDKELLSTEQKIAVDELICLVENSVRPITLSEGEMVFIDNRRCAHGRSEFKPRYDGTDRWLKRCQISTNINYFVDSFLDDRGKLLP